MKTYEEMAKSALARGKAIRKEREKANKVIWGALSGLAVCCRLSCWCLAREHRNGLQTGH